MLPQGWIEVALSDIAELKLGKMLDKVKNRGKLRPYLRNINVRWRSFDLSDLSEMPVLDDEIIEFSVRDGDIFICEGGEPGRAAVWRGGENNLAFQKALHRLRTEINPDFLVFYIFYSAQKKAFDHLLTGTTIKHLPKDALKRMRIPLPPLAEQHRIVAKLDALTARLASARGHLDRMPILAKRLRQVAASQLAATKPGHSVPFDQVLDYKGGSQPPKSTFHKEPGKGRVRLLQIRDFASDEKAVYISDNGKWPRCRADDIMIGRYGASVGKILTGKAGAYNVALVKMLFDRSIINPRFLFHWLSSATFQDKLKSISRSAQDGFNKGDLTELPFPLLPLQEQEEIAAKIDAALAQADQIEAEAYRASALLDRLEKTILAKAFRGELVPQDPNDKPASILLERIRAQRAGAPKRGRSIRVEA